MEYEIIARRLESDLVLAVRDFIRDGWEPLGGATILPQKDGQIFRFYQTMIRRKVA